MVLRLLARVLWGTTKFTVKHVAIPIFTTMVIAAVANELTRRMRGEDHQAGRLEQPAEWHAQP